MENVGSPSGEWGKISKTRDRHWVNELLDFTEGRVGPFCLLVEMAVGTGVQKTKGKVLTFIFCC